MFEEIRKWFRHESENEKAVSVEPTPVDNVKLAAAAVLIGAARADGMFGVEEQQAMLIGVAERLAVDPDKVGELFDQASDAFQAAPLETFLETIRAQMSPQQREAVLTIAWAVIAADGIVTDEENKFALKLRQSLDLTMEQSLRAMKLAQGMDQDGFKELVESSAEVIAKGSFIRP